jgi:hypothetical protein
MARRPDSRPPPSRPTPVDPPRVEDQCPLRDPPPPIEPAGVAVDQDDNKVERTMSDPPWVDAEPIHGLVILLGSVYPP